MRLRLTSFRGEIPKINKTLLPEGAAQVSLDTDHSSGALEPIHQDAVVHTAGTAPVDFYLHKGSTWLTFPATSDVVPGPVADDRLYISREGGNPYLKVMPAGTEYPLALPTPPAPPTVSIETATAIVDPLRETVSYAYTWVSIFDEETLPSPPSALINRAEDEDIRVVFIDQPPSGSRIDRLRVYRTVTSAVGTTEFQFVKELNSATTAYVHDVDVDTLQEVMPSTFYDPPVAGLQGFTDMQSGIIAAFKGKTLYFCEPYKPHAWPNPYELVVNYDIVALVAFGPVLAVLTTGQPYLVQGSAPENMQMERIEQNAPCLSADGVVDLGYAAAYPSTDGLVTISQSGTQIATKPLLTKKQWDAMAPDTISAGNLGGKYVFSYQPSGGGGRKTAILDLTGQEPFLIRSTSAPTHLKSDLYTGALHYIDGGTSVKDFAAIDADWAAMEWRSAEIILPTITSFGAILLEGEHLASPADLTVTIYRDGAQHSTAPVTLNEPQRLPDGLGRRWEIEIEGTARVERVTMSGDVPELWG